MVEHTGPDHKAALIAEIATARAGISRSFGGLRRDADISAHIKSSFSNHKTAWLGGAGIAGWVLSRLPARKKKVKVFVDKNEGHKVRDVAEAGMQAGLVFGILKFLFSLFRPVIMAFATKKITELAARHNVAER